MYKTYFLNGNNAQKLLHKIYLNKLTKTRSFSKKLYFYEVFNKYNGKPFEMWKDVNSLLSDKKSTNSTLDKIKVNEIVFYEPKIIAGHFNTFFYSIGCNLALKVILIRE